MKINKDLLTIILLFLTLWLHYYLGELVYLFLVVIVVVMTLDKSIVQRVINSKMVGALLLVILISYIFNLKNFDVLARNHAMKTGNYMPFLYLKIVGNTFILIIFILYSYSWGYKIAREEKLMLSFFKVIKLLFFLNSFVAMLAWAVTTGGVIARYNFVSPIDNSVSLSAAFAVWGMLITLAQKEKSQLSYLYIIVFSVNILIVVTRLTQVIFIVSLLYFYLLRIKNAKEKVLKYFLFTIAALFFVIMLGSFFTIFFSSYYSSMLSRDSYDVLSRQSSIIAALNIFFRNPFFGVGYGMFGPYNTISFRGFVLESAHNGLFSVLSELGIAGTLVTVIFLIKVFKATTSKIVLSNVQNQNIRNVCIINLRIMIFTFPIANFALLPPPSEKIYYFSALFLWVMLGIVKSQFDLFSKKEKTTFLINK